MTYAYSLRHVVFVSAVTVSFAAPAGFARAQALPPPNLVGNALAESERPIHRLEWEMLDDIDGGPEISLEPYFFSPPERLEYVLTEVAEYRLNEFGIEYDLDSNVILDQAYADDELARRLLDLLDRYSRELLDPSYAPLIIDGTDPPDGEFTEVVAIGGEDGWCCTGLAIAGRTVVTAEHCNEKCDEITRIGIGESTGNLKQIDVEGDPLRPGACAPSGGDIIALTLDKSVRDFGITPAEIAANGVDTDDSELMIVGYGEDENGDRGTKLMALIAVQTAVCGPLEADRDKCTEDIELVAVGPLNADACRGDSGGPGYVFDKYLGRGAAAVIVSRGIRNDPLCGQGGIYTRLDQYLCWLEDIKRN